MILADVSRRAAGRGEDRSVSVADDQREHVQRDHPEPGQLARRRWANTFCMVDLNTGFNVPTMLSSDTIHPNQTGYNFMGDTWYSVIGSYLH